MLLKFTDLWLRFGRFVDYNSVLRGSWEASGRASGGSWRLLGSRRDLGGVWELNPWPWTFWAGSSWGGFWEPSWLYVKTFDHHFSMFFYIVVHWFWLQFGSMLASLWLHFFVIVRSLEPAWKEKDETAKTMVFDLESHAFWGLWGSNMGVFIVSFCVCCCLVVRLCLESIVYQFWLNFGLLLGRVCGVKIVENRCWVGRQNWYASRYARKSLTMLQVFRNRRPDPPCGVCRSGPYDP